MPKKTEIKTEHQLLQDEELVAMHRAIIDALEPFGFQYMTGTYKGLEDVRMNLTRKAPHQRAILELKIEDIS